MVGDEKMRRYKYETPILLDDSCFQTLPNTNISALRNATSSQGHTHLECCLGYGHMRNVRVQLFFCVFLIVAFTYRNHGTTQLYQSRITLKKRELYPRSSLSLIRWGTLLIPCAHTAWFSLGSRRTSAVPIALRENSKMDLTAHGARFLNERPCTSLCRWMVYSRVTTSWRAERVLPPVCVGW
jgi:hypothetical protein